MCSGVGQCIAEKRRIDLSFFKKKKKKNEKLGLEKPTSLSLEKKRTLSHFRLKCERVLFFSNEKYVNSRTSRRTSGEWQEVDLKGK